MKLLLTIMSGSLSGKIFDLKNGFMTIGRTENSTVKFDPLNEKIVSKQHAYIEAKPGGFYLSDNKSTNGTFVNGNNIQTAKLNSGDTIQFGKNGVTAKIFIEQEQILPNAPANSPFQQNQAAFQVSDADYFAQNNPANFRNSISNIGLGNIQEAQPESRTEKYIGIGLTLFGIVFFSLIVIAIVLLSLGPIAAVFATFIAFTPAVIYILPLVWLDRYDPEPLWILALAFAWGALVAVFLSFVINTVIGVGVAVAIDPQIGNIASTVISAPIFEELTKGAGLFIILIFFRRYFDGILDGIIFAGVIALGFATVENVIYYGRAMNEGGLELLVQTFVLRGILSPFAHVTFTAMTGIGCGISRESHNSFVKIVMPIFGLICAVILHAFWNGMAVFLGLGFLVGYAIIEFPLFVTFVVFSFYVMYRQNKILKEMLAIDVARGLIPQEHFEKATSAFKSTFWLLGSVFSGKFRARSRYMRAIGKLGLSYWHIQRATAAQSQTASFQQNPILREEVLKWRDRV